MSAVLKEPAIDYHRNPIGHEDYYKTRGDLPSYIPRDEWKVDVRSLPYKSHIKPKDSDYAFEVLEKRFIVPVKLRHVASQIKESQEIVDYDDNWDDEGATATDGETYLKAVEFIVQYMTYVYEQFSVVLIAPYVDILRDGSISVHWEAGENAQLLVVFRKGEGQFAQFYAEGGAYKVPLKSSIVIDGPINEILVLWMKSHLH